MLIRFALGLVITFALSQAAVGPFVAKTGERPGGETIRAALIEAARTIKSDYERGRVLSAIIK